MWYNGKYNRASGPVVSVPLNWSIAMITGEGKALPIHGPYGEFHAPLPLRLPRFPRWLPFRDRLLLLGVHMSLTDAVIIGAFTALLIAFLLSNIDRMLQ